MRLVDADFEIDHYMSMITNPTPDVNTYDKEHALAIVNAFKMAKTVEERKNDECINDFFRIMQHICKYHTLSYDRVLEEACHHRENIPIGSSWGECKIENCPYLLAK